MFQCYSLKYMITGAFQSKQCQERPYSHKDWLMATVADFDWMLTLCWALCPEHYMQMAESPQHHQAGRAIHIPSHRWGNWDLARWERAFAQGLMLSIQTSLVAQAVKLSTYSGEIWFEPHAKHRLELGSEPRSLTPKQESDWSECHFSPPSQTLQSSASTFSPPPLLFPTLKQPLHHLPSESNASCQWSVILPYHHPSIDHISILKAEPISNLYNDTPTSSWHRTL